MSHTIKTSAEENFANGLYCAESVVQAITNNRGIDSKLLTKASTGFCSGMSRTCGTCGAVTGAILGMSAILGRNNANDSVEQSYKATNDLINQFESKFGSSNCRELLGCDLGTEEGKTTFSEQSLGELCQQYTSHAAELAEKLLPPPISSKL